MTDRFKAYHEKYDGTPNDELVNKMREAHNDMVFKPPVKPAQRWRFSAIGDPFDFTSGTSFSCRYRWMGKGRILWRNFKERFKRK